MSKARAVRKTVSSDIHAKKVYPGIDSNKAATAKYINIVLEADEAKRLADSLIQAASEAEELTIRAARPPAVKTSLHAVSVTYETRKQKA